MRARDLGIVTGALPPGEHNAITDVAGIRVGHTTLIEGEGALRVGEGPVRTGVTVVIPHEGRYWEEPLFAGCHRLNGNGELTGLEWIRESGLLTSPVAITNSHSVGVVHDALIRSEVNQRPAQLFWGIPVVGETWDGVLNDINGFHVTPEHVFAALDGASDGPVEEGGVGGGTGMICHGFKGGIGTASRVLPQAQGGFTLGVLVQANHGRRERLRVNGVPVGERIPASLVPVPEAPEERTPPGAGSIIAVVATDAPVSPTQLNRLAQRVGLGIARTGGVGENTSGDIFLAFSTANRDIPPAGLGADTPVSVPVDMLLDTYITFLFDAVVEATEEAILNALLGAETMTGRDNIVAHALDGHELKKILDGYGP
ncbi:MAG: D-aminopeptidase [Actinomycetota bacterium]|jgi:D-aminopeptidase|nr:D-aminopeptidase [Actinomycetota bacterium]